MPYKGENNGWSFFFVRLVHVSPDTSVRLRTVVARIDKEQDLIADLTEVLLTFADVTEDLGGSKYVMNSMRTLMLMEIIKTVTTDLANNQDSDEEEDDAFENNDADRRRARFYTK
ncbi:hypothetical protein C1646_741816 [Rhizophagus diaphanus]|nr:hypothetical protein C1646_741816 [Rhizophagus diaphanus] [Rhizophagus sp. MUCL 43196]